MPTLEWIGKSKVVNHHLDVPYCVLERKYSYDEKGQHEEDTPGPYCQDLLLILLCNAGPPALDSLLLKEGHKAACRQAVIYEL